MDFGRKLRIAYSSDSSCVWHSNIELCLMDYSKPDEVLSKSENDFAQFVSKYFNCNGKLTKDECLDEDVCYWHENFEVCSLDDYAKDHEDSPCVTAAPANFELDAASVACQKQKTSSVCEKSDNCVWRKDDGCIADIFPIVFNIESHETYLDKFSEVLDAKLGELFFAYIVTFGLTNDPVWTDVLEWNLPKTECPKGFDAKICDAADAFLQIYYPVVRYCGGKYGISDKIGCAQDQYCEYSDSHEICSPSEENLAAASDSSIKALVPHIPNKTDREILDATLNCPSIVEKEECVGKCVWDRLVGYCSINGTYISQLLAAPGKKTKKGRLDPVCKFLILHAYNDCHDEKSAADCDAKDICLWTPTHECALRERGYYEGAVEEANDLDKSTTDIWENCSIYRTERECRRA